MKVRSNWYEKQQHQFVQIVVKPMSQTYIGTCTP